IPKPPDAGRISGNRYRAFQAPSAHAQTNRPGDFTGIRALVPALDPATIPTDRTLVTQIGQAMVPNRLGPDEYTVLGPRFQPPCPERFTYFQHQIPVPRGMIVFQDDITRHGRSEKPAKLSVTLAGSHAGEGSLGFFRDPSLGHAR